MASVGITKRISRIKRRACPEVLAAFENGLISAKRADLLLYLPAGEQALELERRLSEARRREERHQAVALTIKRYLDGLGNQKVDLAQLSKIIKEAVAS
jgi:hypothetical protein